MSLHPDKRLEAVAANLLKRWGRQVFRTLNAAQDADIPHVPTGFAGLDRVLGIGGVPRGCITELAGAPTSGIGTLALSILTQAQKVGDAAAYLDLAQTFDPDYAIRQGVDVSNLLLIHPASVIELLGITQQLVESGAVGLLVADLAFVSIQHQAVASGLTRVLGALTHSSCALLLLSLLESGTAPSNEGVSLTHHAAVRLHLQKQHWLKRRQDVSGYRAQVTVLKNRFAPPNRSTSLVFSGLGDEP